MPTTAAYNSGPGGIPVSQVLRQSPPLIESQHIAPAILHVHDLMPAFDHDKPLVRDVESRFRTYVIRYKRDHDSHTIEQKDLQDIFARALLDACNNDQGHAELLLLKIISIRKGWKMLVVEQKPDLALNFFESIRISKDVRSSGPENACAWCEPE